MTELMLKITTLSGCVWLFSSFLLDMYVSGLSETEKCMFKVYLNTKDISAKDVAERFPTAFALSVVCELTKVATALLAMVTAVFWLIG